MKIDHGYCDTCGCALGGQSYALMLNGQRQCLPCAGLTVAVAVRHADKPEARDDGR